MYSRPYYYFGKMENIYKVEQDSLYFFLEGGFKGNYFKASFDKKFHKFCIFS